MEEQSAYSFNRSIYHFDPCKTFTIAVFSSIFSWTSEQWLFSHPRINSAQLDNFYESDNSPVIPLQKQNARRTSSFLHGGQPVRTGHLHR